MRKQVHEHTYGRTEENARTTCIECGVPISDEDRAFFLVQNDVDEFRFMPGSVDGRDYSRMLATVRSLIEREV